MANILFVLYSDLASNSAGHVVGLANELHRLGHDCVVAVASNPESVEIWEAPAFRTVGYADALRRGVPFLNGQGPQFVHAWTPRETVRRFCGSLSERYSYRQFVHLEDNEAHVTQQILGVSGQKLGSLSQSALDALIPLSLSHPVRSKEFLASSAGVTVIIDALRTQVPSGVPVCLVWPSADETLFYLRPIDHSRRSALGVPVNSTVLVYTGNVHAANAAEVRSLYLAVAMLNREGHPTTLLRTGQDFYPFLGDNETWAKRHSVELGFLHHRRELAEVASLADLFVQPGRPGPFNDYRFPSKLPEYFALGRPVILPHTNVGLEIRHCEDAYVLPSADATAIAGAVQVIMGDPPLYDRLAQGARAFFEARLSWQRSAQTLSAFYAGV